MSVDEKILFHLERRFEALLGMTLLLLFGFYNFEFLRFRPYDIDNPWFLSFSYNFGVDRIGTDTFLMVRFPGGMDGTHLFGKIAAAIQYVFLNHFAWQQRPAEILSSILIVVSLGLLSIALRRMGYAASVVLPVMLIAGLSEPLLAAAERFRYEPEGFLFFSAGLLLATYRQVFAAMLIACLAVEIQPIAIASVIPVVVLCLLQDRRVRTIVTMLAAGCSALAIDLYFHPEFLHPSGILAAAGGTSALHLGQLTYFMVGRHYAEILIPIAAVILFLKAGRAVAGDHVWLLLSAGSVTLLFLIFAHPNRAYMIYLYPLLVLLLIAAIPTPRWRFVVTAICCTYFLTQYAVADWVDRGQGYTRADITQVQTLIDGAAGRMGKNAADLSILGHYSLWYAHPHKFHAAWSAAGEDLVLCYRSPLPGLSRPHAPLCGDILKGMPDLRLDSTADIRGNMLDLYVHDDAASYPVPTERR